MASPVEHRLTGEQIRVGEPVPYDCYDSHGQLLLRKGLVVYSQRQVDFLLESGLYRKGGSGAAPHEALMSSQASAQIVSPFQLMDDYQNRLKQIFSTLNSESGAECAAGTFRERVLQLAASLQKLCEQDQDALLGSLHMDIPTRYSVDHPLRRAILCEMLGRRKSLPPEERSGLLAAALTSDLSMLKLQEDLFKQASPLLPVQKQAIRAHPGETVKMLQALGVSDAIWMTAVLQHHELLNGTGYPQGLTTKHISVWSRILVLADIYTAMVTPRVYRKALLSKAAMRDIFLKRGAEIDEEMAIFVVKELGVYPPGAFVKLQNGELAVVIRRTDNPKAPEVKAVVGPRGAPLDRPIARDTRLQAYEILDVVERDPLVPIDLHQLWNYKTN